MILYITGKRELERNPELKLNKDEKEFM